MSSSIECIVTLNMCDYGFLVSDKVKNAAFASFLCAGSSISSTVNTYTSSQLLCVSLLQNELNSIQSLGDLLPYTEDNNCTSSIR